jgi:hypothetical protein
MDPFTMILLFAGGFIAGYVFKGMGQSTPAPPPVPPDPELLEQVRPILQTEGKIELAVDTLDDEML